ncbi:MAG TPA: NAD(P)-binding protein [Tepidisphaeraceae bacterium]|jgi:voltage-gated potassium channel Kch
MADEREPIELSLSGHAIIAGFGVPGRAVADVLAAHGVEFCVIELNPKTVERCAHTGVHIIAGDVCNEETLRRAGVHRSTLLVLAVPNDNAVLEAVSVARRMNPTLRILARCRFISSGMEAHRRGASEVIVEEQVVASEMTRLLEAGLARPKPPASEPEPVGEAGR